jgi:hypothetical protein
VSTGAIYIGGARLIDDDPRQDITILREPARLRLVMQGGVIHKEALSPVLEASI